MPFSCGTENPYKELYIYYLSGKFRPPPLFQPDHFIGNWQEGDFSFLFFSQPSETVVKEVIAGNEDLALLDHYHMTFAQWHGDEIAPFQLGGFTIAPPWIPVDTASPESTIVLDPGVVFGTGTHPTTRDSLKAVQLALADRSVRSALDLGTGTGLLALTAAKLGCRAVLATDLNLLAVTTAQRNVQRNGLCDRVLVAQGDAEKFIDFTSDLVISNIHYDVMKKMVRATGFGEKKRFVLSGLMRGQAAIIESELAARSMRIIRKWDRNGIWYTFYGACGRN